MLFERFLKKRKQAAVEAKQAVEVKSQDTLTDQARTHPDAETRRDAARQLIDPRLLRQLLTEDDDARVRETAADRYRQLIRGADTERVPLDALLAALAQTDDPRLLDEAATQGGAPEVRRAAIERVSSPEVLARCAVEDALATNRGLAIDRLHDRQYLEQVARQIGKRDKHVYRGAREKLRLLAERDALPQRVRDQCQEIQAKAERLGRLGNWSQDRALLEHLDRQWAAVDWTAIEPQVETEWQTRYRAEHDRFLAAYHDYCSENAAQIAERETHEAVRAERKALLEALSTAPTLGEESEIAALRERIQTAWDALPSLPPQRQRPLDAEYERLLLAADAARQAFADRRRDRERLRKTIAKVERLLEGSKALDHKAVQPALDQGRALAASLASTSEANDFPKSAERLESRLKHQRKNAEQRLKQLPERLAELETHLAAGELKKADPLYQSLQAGLELIQLSGLPRGAEAEIANRLRTLAPQFRELQHWRRWGADQHREGLCADMETLIDKDLPLEALAEQLHTLQMDWKGLDKSGSPANQALWERFHTASESVYARCRPFMEAQATERDANRHAREQVCQQIEEFLGKVDWERVDWKKILRAERDTRQTWAAIGPTEGRHRKALERRFHQSLRQLDQRLDAERKRNQALKHQLIEQVRAQIETPDLDAAIERTKALQREWRTTVPARQKDENRLWRGFRAACDAVFERRAALHQAHANELKDNLAAREAICAEAMACATSERDPKRLAAGQREFEERWRATQAMPMPRQAAGALAQRWQDCRDALEQARRAGEDSQRQAALALIRQRADLCERLELSLLGEAGEALDPRAARQLWEQCPTQPDSEPQQALAARFESALTAAQDPERLAELRERFAANASRRAQICLQLEIIAGVESPPELAQERLEFQVARLAERMVEGEGDPLQGASRLLNEWYLCGPAPRDDSLNARFEHLRRALTSERKPQEGV